MSVWGLWLLTLLVGCRAADSSGYERAYGALSVPQVRAQWTLSLAADLSELAVEAEFADWKGGRLVGLDEALAFITGAELFSERGTWVPLEFTDGSFLVPRGSPKRRLRWSFDLQAAARSSGQRRGTQLARKLQGALLSSPAAWLLRPDELFESGRSATVRGRVLVAEDSAARFACALQREAGAEPGRGRAFVFPMPTLTRLPYVVFGDFVSTSLALGQAEVELVRLQGALRVSDQELFAWARECAAGVAAYYGRFPVPRALCVLEPGGRGAGRAYGHGAALVHVPIGAKVAADELRDDWILVHELVHLACPLLPRRQHWFEEGLSTYVEPFIRLELGHIDAEELWSVFVEMMPYGLPASDDRGLDLTHTWGRTYWGGALFCLLADVEIRKASAGQRTLRDALAGVVDRGWSIRGSASILDVLQACDQAVGAAALVPLYRQHAQAAVWTDLDELWRLHSQLLQGDLRAAADGPGPGSRAGGRVQ